ncbi:high-temperature-induced dauer-formation protein [Glomus cerebriforme]|uniref:High-temperature-induced dauer-formation protein n=1 Tax=Glomus cerebriforme TaxID=658196 RepID=A0A397TQV7_9GLOM|nr:high-temperature-induced dauer-formation protein [Glomus cerebriforme]
MGATESKLAFRKGVFRLFEERNIRATDEYWSQFWLLPESAEDVFSLVGAQDIRRVRDHAKENLETLIYKVIDRLFRIIEAPDFPSPQNSVLQLLNCIRILTRLIPFIFESEEMSDWEEKFFWTPQTRRDLQTHNTSDIETIETIEAIPPLGERLLSTIIDLLFLAGFTLPANLATENSRIIYVNWETGVGSTLPIGSSKENDSNKTETLRLLLAFISKSMYMPGATYMGKENKWIKYLVLKTERKVVLALLCSLLNTAVKYNPAGWGVPYNHVVFADSRELLVTMCLQVLLVLLDYRAPSNRHLPSHVDNAFRYYTSKLHRSQDFQFLMDGIYRILNNPMQASNTYLPGSTKQIQCHQEMMMLCWKFLEINKRFRNYLLDTDRVLDLLIVLLYYAIENKQEPAQLGLVRMCAFILQTLSGDRDFGVKLNKVFENHGSLPGNVRIHAFHGTYADYMISSIYALIATTRGTLHSLYPAYILTITNVSPYLKNLSVVSSTRLVHLFSQFTSPVFLLAEEGNHRLVEYMLEAFNNIIQYQFSDNPHLIYAILRSPKCFENLSEFSLAKGLTEIKAAKEKRKKQVRIVTTAEQPEVKNSQDESSRPLMSDNESNLSTQKDEDHEKTESAQITSNADDSEDSQIEIVAQDSAPLSEKARGKLPEGVTVASRRRSNENNNVITPFAVGKSGFVPTEDWVSSWHSHLPLGTILILLGELIPKIEAICVSQSINSDQPVLEFLRKITMVGILPPPQSILIRKFQWSEASVVWFSSLLWGQIYLAASNYLGVFNGTQVKLFFVKPSVREGRLKNALGNAVGGVQGVIDRLSTPNTPNTTNTTTNTTTTTPSS